jgi:phage shock protein C
MIMAGYYSSGRRLYRSREGEILGICRGIAEWRDLPVSVVRWTFVLIALFTAVMPVILVYFILGLILPLEPEYREKGRRRGYRASGDEDIESDFEDLKRRVNRMEEEELDKEKDWENRFRKGR